MIERLTITNFKLYSKDLFNLLVYLFKIDHFKNSNLLAQKKMNEINRYLDDKSAKIFVFVIDKEVKGFIWFYLISNNEIHIPYFVVDEKYQHKGVGRCLLKCCEKYAQNKNIHKISLNAINNNAKLFYKKMDYLSDDNIFYTKSL